MSHRIRSTIVTSISVTLIALIASVFAKPEPTTAPTITPEAKALLDQTRDAYAKLNSLELAGTSALDVDAAGQTGKFNADFTSSFQAPNKLRHEMKDDVNVVSTGEKLIAHLLPRNTFVSLDAPKSRGEPLPAPVRELIREQNPSLYLAITSDGVKEITDTASDVKKIEDVKLDDSVGSYPALQFTYPSRDVRLLIDPTTHLVRQAQIDFRKSLEKSGVPQIKRAVATIEYTKSQADASVDAARFAWSAPVGATQIKPDAPELTGLASAGGAEGGGGSDAPAKALVGKPAADFKLEDASGKAVALADLKGSVVVLDFWATWCPPCREELPHLDKIASTRAPDGVKTFAVNLREDQDKVAKFVAANNLQMAVLFDFNGQVAAKFLVEGIPQTVIIDKQGVVRHVSVGWGGDESVAELNAAIDAAMKQ